MTNNGGFGLGPKNGVGKGFLVLVFFSFFFLFHNFHSFDTKLNSSFPDILYSCLSNEY